MINRIKGLFVLLTAAVCSFLSIAQCIPAAASDEEVPQFEELAEESQEPVKSYSVPDIIAESGEDTEFSIVPTHAARCSLDLGAGSNLLQLYSTHRNANQRWKLQRAGAYYRIISVSNGYALNSQNDMAGKGVRITTKPINPQNNAQLWKIQPAGDGSYFIRAYSENYAIDIDGKSTSNGTAAHLYTFHGENHQRFWFEPVNKTKPMEEWGASRQDCNGSDWDYWDGTWDNSWYYADTKARTYYLDTADQLAGLAQLVRDGVTSFEGQNIVLTRDINLGGIEWRRIGQNARPFRGSFIGGNHAIIGLSITTTDSEDGFFGCVCGAVIRDFAIKGAVSGDFNLGGVCGKLDNGIIYNVYSEVSLTRSTDDNEGGIAGRVSYGACVEHCTQNAFVNSGDKDPDRGGIGGYCVGLIRYCVNLSTVECNWNYCGGIAGECVGGMIEYCANYGKIAGGDDTQWAGGIAGKLKENGLIFGCYNEGYIYSGGDDYIGGICGDHDDSRIYCCINAGDVQGRSHVGGITGDSNCKYCLNTGTVGGSSKVGALTGDTSQRLEWCRALKFSATNINGTHDANGGEWVTAQQLISGEVCYRLNHNGNILSYISGYCDNGAALGEVFYQNVGADAAPRFSGASVRDLSGQFGNEQYNVDVSYQKDYGTVTGSGTYSAGETVTLTAVADDACVFDHYEVTAPVIKSQKIISSITKDYVELETKIYRDPELKLTDKIDASYRVKAVFSVYDEIPEDLRQKVRLQLRCSDGCDGWNSNIIPVYLLDSAGQQYLWEVSRFDLDDTGEKVERTFDLGAASPVAVYAYPNFGGGVTFRGLSLRSSIWINDAGESIESGGISINSYPFMSSGYKGDYMHLTFKNQGKAQVGILREDGTLNVKGTYSKPTEAWDAAQKLGDQATLRLISPWLTDREFTVKNSMTLDLNGFPMIRSIKKAEDNGNLLRVNNRAALRVIDSAPSRISCSAFKGGSIQGGRSKNTGGLVQVESGGTLDMTGGALYNGGTTNRGGAIQNNGGNVTLENVLIANCWANKHDGGGVYTTGGSFAVMDCRIRACNTKYNGGGLVVLTKDTLLENTLISGCKAKRGGAVYLEQNSLTMDNCKIKNCSADEGGAIDKKGKTDGAMTVRDTLFEQNNADNKGGAVSLFNKSNARMLFSGCAFSGNSSKEGSALYTEDDYVALENVTMRSNRATGHGGAVYVKDVDLGLQKTIIIEKNTTNGSADNVYLTSKGRLSTGGLTEGSCIHLTPAGKGEQTVFESISQKQLSYFQVDDGAAIRVYNSIKRERFVSSAISYGSVLTIIIMSAAVILTIAAVFVIKKKRTSKKKKDENGAHEPESLE